MNKTVEIKIWGIVQGVGFRPFISRLAEQHRLTGTVLNEAGSVRIIVSGPSCGVDAFCEEIVTKKPEPSEIIHMEILPRDYAYYPDFNIIESSQGGNDLIFIPADLSICGHCEAELYKPADPRYRHPFISCMECGPRYSIMDIVPYDRENTAMVDFEMCSYCNGQYKSSKDRRYHAQTISCHDCGPRLIYKKATENAALQQAISDLKQGRILAVKGIGGYHLACTPFNTNTVEQLRALKGREEKPFAVMFKTLAQIETYCFVSEQEKQLLATKEKPIVLLKQKPHRTDLSPSVYKSSLYLGVFLPYTPLQHLLLEETGPLIMTSANISDRPIIIEDEEMLSMESPYLAGVLYNKRAIRIRQDDSVAKCIDGETQLIRRARGYAPLPIFVEAAGEEQTSVDVGNNHKQVLACGGQLKNTFCLTKGNFAYPSQYIGDIEDNDTFESYKENITRMQQLFRVKPETVCCDLHPDYMTTQFAVQYAEEKRLPLIKIQHHYAHIASVMAEKNIKDKVIGVAFDGTGYGDDGKVWGGEFLICSPTEYRRAGHLKYIKAIGGDSSMKEAWKSACMYLYDTGLESEIADERWPLLKAALVNKINTIETSSMGRLFDAVSALLDIQQVSNFEGECAIKLENAASAYISREISPAAPYDYQIVDKDGKLELDVSACIKQIVSDKKMGLDRDEIAYKFHKTVSDFTTKLCLNLREQHKIDKVALSGGVFQNSVLLELTLSMLRAADFTVYYNTLVPPNDGGISLGQAYIAMHSERA